MLISSIMCKLTVSDICMKYIKNVQPKDAKKTRVNIKFITSD